jgi:inosine/xanthosine triphosphatase
LLELRIVVFGGKMKLIAVASSNPVKRTAALEGFIIMFPGEEFRVVSVDAKPSVSAQPMTDKETLQGAEERALLARSLFTDADFWVGIEGGVADWEIGMGAFAWVVVLSRQQSGRGRSGEFFLPEKVAALVRQGIELGEADDRIFSRNNSKQGNGAIGLLTGDAIDRKNLYIPAVIFALIPFKNPELY